MISVRQIAWFLGDKPAKRPVLPVTAVQPLQDLRFPGLIAQVTSARWPGFTLWSGSHGVFRVDPPVGGFASADFLLHLPESNGKAILTTIASMVPNLSIAFAPGIYRIEHNLISSIGFATTVSAIVACLGQARENGAVGLTGLGANIPGVYSRLIGTGNSTSVKLVPRLRLRSNVPWGLFLSAQTALTDTQTFEYGVTVLAETLFEESGNIF